MDDALKRKLRKIALQCNDYRTTDALGALVARAGRPPRLPPMLLDGLSAPYFGMQLTPWFSPRRKELPVRDGVYITRHITTFGASESWHAFRWNCNVMAWYSADSVDAHESDLIGASANNVHFYEWCGLLSGGAV